jgi:hypothetical protein
LDLKDARKDVVERSDAKAKEQYANSSFSRGYGGEFGKEVKQK